MNFFKNIGFFNNDIYFKKISSLVFGAMLKFSVQFCILIFFSRKLSLTDYSLYQYVWMLINIFSVITLFGIPQLLLAVTHQQIYQFVYANKKAIIRFCILFYGAVVCYLVF